jgi:hypothetical protein
VHDERWRWVIHGKPFIRVHYSYVPHRERAFLANVRRLRSGRVHRANGYACPAYVDLTITCTSPVHTGSSKIRNVAFAIENDGDPNMSEFEVVAVVSTCRLCAVCRQSVFSTAECCACSICHRNEQASHIRTAILIAGTHFSHYTLASALRPSTRPVPKGRLAAAAPPSGPAEDAIGIGRIGRLPIIVGLADGIEVP